MYRSIGMRPAFVAIVIAACGGGKSDAPCRAAVHHVFELTTTGPPDSKPKADEQQLIDSIEAATLDRCKREGLSAPVADCIMAAHPPDWDDQLRACPAFAAKPPSWVMLRPTRADRMKLMGHAEAPDGPRESKVHYQQLVALSRSTCGLTDAGAIQCWGQPLAAPAPAGPFVQIAIEPEQTCGRAASGVVTCSPSDFGVSNRTPTTPFSDFAIGGYQGCGIRTSDKQIECWNDLDDGVLDPPVAQFTSLVVDRGGACGRTTEGAAPCFGDSPPALPPANVLAYSSDKGGTCTIDAAHHLTCTGTELFGPTPTGSFDTVAIARGHACAVRTGGGTVCWGENDDGECNVPQR